MFKIIKNLNWIILSSFLCLFIGILTFFTFINEGPINLTDNNLQILLILDAIILFIFFYLIFKNIFRIYFASKKKRAGSQTNLKYISLFTLFTFIPSLIVAIFSLFIFNFGLQKYFDNQITKAVNNSYDVARIYYENSKENIKSDAILISVGLNKSSSLFYSNPSRFKSIMRIEKILRRVDDVYLIDSTGNVLISEDNLIQNFIIPDDENFNAALDGLPIITTNNPENKTSAILKLNSLIDTYLYISRDIDPEILRYLNETEQAVDFYYSVENSQTGIKITFAIIYIIVVTLLLFLSIVIAFTFARRLTIPIINLIGASENISKGLLDAKVPEIDADSEIKKLNRNFNNMIDRLKKQQVKLLNVERHEAWESVARKLAHEIKNPLTPIQLSIDRLREKYSKKIKDSSSDFDDYLETINRQIKDIEKLANEFSNFARMPRPIFKKINVIETINKAIDFIKMSSKYEIVFKSKNQKLQINADSDQLYRVFINLIKNSEEAIHDKQDKSRNFKGKILIEIDDNSDYIVIKLMDNGSGMSDIKKAMTPYYTTKSKGTGLGLPIVSKIITDHSGDIQIENNKNGVGAKIEISFPKIK